MRPTMKLRWYRVYYFASNSVSVFDADVENKYVLQQWWEGQERLEGLGVARFKTIGEWRDIPIEVDS